MNFLPNVKNGEIVIKKNKKKKRVGGMRRNRQNPRLLKTNKRAKELWREYYQNTDWIKDIK